MGLDASSNAHCPKTEVTHVHGEFSFCHSVQSFHNCLETKPEATGDRLHEFHVSAPPPPCSDVVCMRVDSCRTDFCSPEAVTGQGALFLVSEDSTCLLLGGIGTQSD